MPAKKHRPGSPSSAKSRPTTSRATASQSNNSGLKGLLPLLAIAVLGVGVLVGIIVVTWPRQPDIVDQDRVKQLVAGSLASSAKSGSSVSETDEASSSLSQKGLFMLHRWLICWADEQPEFIQSTDESTGNYSNIAPQDYVRPDTCGRCHEKQFEKWSQSPHAKMNTTATPETIVGDFENGQITYDGGTMRTFREDGEYLMETKRGDDQRTFQITRTIGSRFYQYYVGKVVDGDPVPEQADLECGPDHPLREIVLPFGFWLKKKRWVPVYDVFDFVDDDDAKLAEENTYDVYGNYQPKPYYLHCGRCHTTMPEGYRMLWDPNPVAWRKPKAHLTLWNFLDDTLEEMAPEVDPRPKLNGDALFDFVQEYGKEYGPEHAATLGISCEACHYGGRVHSESDGKVPPRFVTSSPHLTNVGMTDARLGRSALNVNLTCSKCHSAFRTTLPSGEVGLNSGEFLDAIQGKCYTQAKCTSCHDPHEAIGPKWPKTPQQDDHSCIQCHQEYESPEAIEAHTHHPAGSVGSSCMDCHMPKITEGLQDVVRTHRIDSPNRDESFYEGGVNACNLCHLDQSLDWSMNYLTDWYGRSYEREKVAEAAGSISEPAGRLWLKSPDARVRMTTIGNAKIRDAQWLVPDLAEHLDSSLMIHRQFATDAIETLSGKKLSDLGYQFWLTPRERTPELMRQVRQGLKNEESL